MQPPAGTQDAETREIAPATPPAIPPATPPMSQGVAPPPPAPTLVGPAGDTCPSCGAAMATDQRYCIECGERRGESRMPDPNEQAAAATQPAPAAYPPPQYAQPPASGRRSSGMALIATVGLLLLAMGVGVLIGNKSGDTGTNVAQQPVVIGGAATAATGATDATAAAADASSKDTAAAATNDKAGVDADAVAKKNGVKLAKPDVKVGDKCESGAAGCDGGKFTGDFFGN